MRTIGNILWLLLAGWWLALLYAIAGLLACVLIVTIPFGIAALRLAGYTLWPFGRRVVVHRIGIPFGFASLKLSVLALVPLGTRVVDAAAPSTHDLTERLRRLLDGEPGVLVRYLDMAPARRLLAAGTRNRLRGGRFGRR